ncbi:MAG: ferrous iron transport protein B, partial [Flavobacteriales bacterium]
MKIALVGNPNCGKTTLFNRLTGRRAKVSNMPGVTVERYQAPWKDQPGVQLVDLPGTYSLFAKADDERVTQRELLDAELQPDAVWIVLDSAHVRSSLFLALQVLEMGFPATVIINRTDTTDVRLDALEAWLGVPAFSFHFEKERKDRLHTALADAAPRVSTHRDERLVPDAWNAAFSALNTPFPNATPVQLAWHLRTRDLPTWLTSPQTKALENIRSQHAESTAAMQLEEAGWRMEHIRNNAEALIPNGPEFPWEEASERTTRIDRILTHPVWGNAILALVFFGIFQAVYAWSEAPMDAVDRAFGWLYQTADGALADGWWKGLLLDGVLNGIAGIVVFVPQIMILFGLTSALEATGYMARVGFLGDRFLERLGLSGRSVVPLIGGMACAVPAVMAARSIPGKREQLITILVTPLMTCAARLPVYAFLIGFVVPNTTAWGFKVQGLFLFGLYVASSVSALALAWALNRGLPTKTEGQFTMEWPAYRWPKLGEVVREMGSKGWSFVSSAGQVILVISVVIWGLSQFGPSEAMEAVEERYAQMENAAPEDIEAARMEASWLGHLGNWIEPAVQPLGYDGRMGIAILSSFAAREVFVGTMSTLFP